MMGNCWKRVTFPTFPTINYKMSCLQCCGSKIDRDHQSFHDVKINGGKVHLVNTVEGWEAKLSEANKDGKIVVANFCTLWCNPCRTISPTYCELSEKYHSMIFVTVDVDKLTALSTSWGIKASPTFIFLKDGRQIDKYVGADKHELSKKLGAISDLTVRNNN